MKIFIGIALGLVLAFLLIFLLAQPAGWTSATFIVDRFEALREHGGNPVVIAATVFLLLAGDLVLPVPSSIVMTVSGRFLGLGAGLAVSFAGAMASALIGFGLCRILGRTAFRSLAGDRDVSRVERFLDRYGVWAIVLSRSVPMLTEVISCLAGLGGMSFARFTALTALGTLPVCAVYAWAGARAGDPTGIGVALVVAFVVPAAGFGVVRWIETRSGTGPAP